MLKKPVSKFKKSFVALLNGEALLSVGLFLKRRHWFYISGLSLIKILYPVMAGLIGRKKTQCSPTYYFLKKLCNVSAISYLLENVKSLIKNDTRLAEQVHNADETDLMYKCYHENLWHTVKKKVPWVSQQAKKGLEF